MASSCPNGQSEVVTHCRKHSSSSPGSKAADKQAMQLFVDENASFEVKLRGNEERIAEHEYHLEEAEDPREKIGYKLAWKIEVMSQGFKFILEAFEKMHALQNEVPDPNDRYSLICEKYMDNRYDPVLKTDTSLKRKVFQFLLVSSRPGRSE